VRSLVNKNNFKSIITDIMSLVDEGDELQGRDNEFND